MELTLLFVLLSVALVQSLPPGIPIKRDSKNTVPIRVTVENRLSNQIETSYYTAVPEGGVLFGALNNLQDDANSYFKFTVTIDPTYGLFLESVNGVAGSEKDQTFWEILSESKGILTSLDVGIGCYTPRRDEHIILRFSSWANQ